MHILFIITLMSAIFGSSRSLLSSSLPRFGRKFGMSMMSGVSYKTGFMFPGQGAQTVGMAGALCEELPEAKELFTKVR